MKSVILICCMAVLAGCSCPKQGPKTQYVVLRDVPENPSITIMPINYSEKQTDMVILLEEMLLSFRVKIVIAPSIREVITQKGVTFERDDPRDMFGESIMEGNITERYFSYGDFASDYVLISDADDKRIKIININTQEILTSFTYENVYSTVFKEGRYEKELNKSFQKELYNTLVLLGIINTS